MPKPSPGKAMKYWGWLEVRGHPKQGTPLPSRAWTTVGWVHAEPQWQCCGGLAWSRPEVMWAPEARTVKAENGKKDSFKQ